jgi:hypothetical protein
MRANIIIAIFLATSTLALPVHLSPRAPIGDDDSGVDLGKAKPKHAKGLETTKKVGASFSGTIGVSKSFIGADPNRRGLAVRILQFHLAQVTVPR